MRLKQKIASEYLSTDPIFGLTVVRKDMHRTIFRIDIGDLRGSLLKVPKDPQKTYINKYEIDNYKRAKQLGYDHYFSDINMKHTDTNTYKYIVMEDNPTKYTDEQDVETIKNQLKEKNIGNLQSINTDNVGYCKDNNLVLTDYEYITFPTDTSTTH